MFRHRPIVRDYRECNDLPASLVYAAESIVCAYKTTTLSPVVLRGRGYVVDLQKRCRFDWVTDQMERMNFPTRHRLKRDRRGSDVIAEAKEVILGWSSTISGLEFLLECSSATLVPLSIPGQRISMNSTDLFVNSYRTALPFVWFASASRGKNLDDLLPVPPS